MYKMYKYVQYVYICKICTSCPRIEYLFRAAITFRRSLLKKNTARACGARGFSVLIKLN